MKIIQSIMKTYIQLLAIAAAMTTMVACEDLDDNSHYNTTITPNENVEIISVEESSKAYLQSRGDLSKMTRLFAETDIFTELEAKGQLHTMLVVADENFDESLLLEDQAYIAKSHVTDIAVSPSKLNDGDRLLMWHEKYVTITTDSAALMGNIIGHVMFNNASLSEVIKTADGYIYVISDLITTPTSLQDYINDLDSTKYGMFKQMVLSSGGQEFDRANSKVIGVDNDGNTIYDTVWIYTNEFFDAKNFNLSSEALKATMLVFSDEVINKALADADAKLRAWGYRVGEPDSPTYIEGRSDDVLRQWILEVAFFNKIYSAANLTPQAGVEDESVNDVKSIYNRQWRTSVQSLDLNNPVSLSNGVAYEVTDFRFPTNVLIYRLKEYFTHHEYCDADEKARYFKTENLAFEGYKVGAEAWTPLPGVWPLHESRYMTMKFVDANTQKYSFDFTPISANPNGEGGYAVQPTMVPPGDYRFAMGFVEYKGTTGYTVKISLHVVSGVDTIEVSEPVDILLDATTGTTYHMDRGATLSNTYPEGYDKNALEHSKAQNYDTDGGLIQNVVTIPDLNGDQSAQQILIRMETVSINGLSSFAFHHWCLRPTADNY